jgi:hypothetical protein
MMSIKYYIPNSYILFYNRNYLKNILSEKYQNDTPFYYFILQNLDIYNLYLNRDIDLDQYINIINERFYMNQCDKQNYIISQNSKICKHCKKLNYSKKCNNYLCNICCHLNKYNQCKPHTNKCKCNNVFSMKCIYQLCSTCCLKKNNTNCTRHIKS